MRAFLLHSLVNVKDQSIKAKTQREGHRSSFKFFKTGDDTS